MWKRQKCIQKVRGAALVLFVTLITAAVGCSTLRVRADYSRRIDFSNFHTYSWLRVRAGNSLWAERIRRDVNLDLAARGWREVASGGEASVAAFGATREQPTLQTFYSSFGPTYGGWYWDGFGLNQGYATTRVVYTPIGTLVVDIFNNSNKRLIWRGVARQALSGDPDRNQEKLAHAITKMFKNFPPPSRG
jgi:hypothetical protein